MLSGCAGSCTLEVHNGMEVRLKDSRKVSAKVQRPADTHVHVEDEGADVEAEESNSHPVWSPLAIKALEFSHFIEDRNRGLHRSSRDVVIGHRPVLLLAWCDL